MKIGIMQPYFWPYLGYFQLINAVDKFVIYDDIKYTKKGWINRNRYLCNGDAKYFTIPIEKDSDFLNVKDRKVSKNFDRKKLENQIRMSYVKAPFFYEVFPLFCDCIEYSDENLFGFINYSVGRLKGFLDIDTEVILSSSLSIEEQLKGKDKVIAICKKLCGTEYINPIGGQCLYDKQEFKENGIELSFILMSKGINYGQFQTEFVPSLSILDVMMFNSVYEIKKMLYKYTLE